MVPNPRGVRRKTPEKKRTKKRESLVVKRRLFPSFFHFVNLREIHRESLPNNFNPIVEYLRLKQDSLYLETQKAYYGLSEKDIDNFYATRYPKFRERMRELQQSGMVRAYAPLAEISSGLVAQFEHAMIVKEKPLVYTRHEDDEW